MLVTREGFEGVVANAFLGMGFAAEPSQVVYPTEMFVPGGDLQPIKTKMDELVAGLTEWEPATKGKQTTAPPRITAEGENYQNAVDNIEKLFLRNLWTDGLPIRPPTAELVDWVLTGTDLSRDDIVAKILPRGGIATVETIAVCLAMAGGRPEYMPPLIAAVEAITDPGFDHASMQATTCNVSPVLIVNGPVARQIRLNSGYGCLGPDPRHPAGGSIGRAIRLLLLAVGGAVPGMGTMSIHGGPNRYTNLVFAEDEDELPEGWEPLSVQQGFPRGTDTATAYAVASITNMPGGEVADADSALATLNRASGLIGVPNGNYWYRRGEAAGILLLALPTIQGLSKLGWSREEVQSYLWENSKIPASKLGPSISTWWSVDGKILEDPMPVAENPKGIVIVAAGGTEAGHMVWLQVGCCPGKMTSAEIKLPTAWEELLQKAQEDLPTLA